MHMRSGHFGGNFIGPVVSLAVRRGERRNQRNQADNRLGSFHRVIPQSLPARGGSIGLWSQPPRIPSIQDATRGQTNCGLVLSYFFRCDRLIMFKTAKNANNLALARHNRAHDRVLLPLLPGGEGRDEGEQLFAPEAPHYIGQKKSVVHPAQQSHSGWARAISPALINFITGAIS